MYACYYLRLLFDIIFLMDAHGSIHANLSECNAHSLPVFRDKTDSKMKRLGQGVKVKLIAQVLFSFM